MDQGRREAKRISHAKPLRLHDKRDPNRLSTSLKKMPSDLAVFLADHHHHVVDAVGNERFQHALHDGLAQDWDHGLAARERERVEP